MNKFQTKIPYESCSRCLQAQLGSQGLHEVVCHVVIIPVVFPQLLSVWVLRGFRPLYGSATLD